MNLFKTYENESEFIEGLENYDFNSGGDLPVYIGKRVELNKKVKQADGFYSYVKNPEKAKKIADEIIKNTYRTLMTRGQKGCYIYCTNKNLSNYLKRRLNQNNTTMYQFDIEENTTNIMVAEDNETYKYK